MASSIYDDIRTAKELIQRVQLRGFSTKCEDICKAQDIFGNTPIQELVALANDIGRNDENGNPDPKGSWSSSRRETRSTFYMIASHIWNWEDMTRFWNQHSNPEHEEVQELRKKLKDEMKEHSATKVSLKAELDKTQVEHSRYLEELTAKREAKAEIESLKAQLYDRDMEIMELKAKLYDLMMKEAK